MVALPGVNRCPCRKGFCCRNLPIEIAVSAAGSAVPTVNCMPSPATAWMGSSPIWISAVRIPEINIGLTMILATGLVKHPRGYAEIDGRWPAWSSINTELP